MDEADGEKRRRLFQHGKPIFRASKSIFGRQKRSAQMPIGVAYKPPEKKRRQVKKRTHDQIRKKKDKDNKKDKKIRRLHGQA